MWPFKGYFYNAITSVTIASLLYSSETLYDEGDNKMF